MKEYIEKIEELKRLKEKLRKGEASQYIINRIFEIELWLDSAMWYMA